MSYPFAALVGQESLRQALLLCAINPTLGGILIRGDKGTAKSTAARGLAELLPDIEKHRGCHFNCEAGHFSEWCEVCADGGAVLETLQAPFINLPLGATEDRVIGSLDFEKALKEGRRAFQSGLLASAHKGVLYIDEINLLADHLVDILLDTAAMGVNTIQREGLSISHPSRFTLIGTMNAEEGDLRPQLLDRFGLMIEIEAPADARQRAMVVERRIEYEADPNKFCLKWQGEEAKLRDLIKTSRLLLAKTSLDSEWQYFISKICHEFGAKSLRADIVMNKTARTLAALDGRTYITREDVQAACELVLPHRRRQNPHEKPGLDKEKLDELMRDAPSNGEAEKSSEDDRGRFEPENLRHDQPEQFEEEGGPACVAQDSVFQTDTGFSATNVSIKSRFDSPNAHSGRRSTIFGASRGQYQRSRQEANPSSLALDATITSSVIRNCGTLQVERVDFHEKVKVAQKSTLIVFVVDASGSMAARKRMEHVKGAVLSLLTEAYQRRDKVSLISFAGEEAQLVLKPTSSVDEARERLDKLATGGRTPLSSALDKVLELISRDKSHEEPFLVFLTDGRSNVPQSAGKDAWQESLKKALSLGELGLPALVINTETGFVKLNLAGRLAEALGAELIRLDDLSSQSLALVVRSRLKKR
jgi:magnesium chelatase subunit D